jgi:DNA-directed RNA polymerase beta' subunit
MEQEVIPICEHDTLEYQETIIEDSIWWEVLKCKICGKKYKTCHNHWGLVEVI